MRSGTPNKDATAQKADKATKQLDHMVRTLESLPYDPCLLYTSDAADE